ncbi:MAG: hypothetical protein ABIQ51_07695 [Mesorhizobium sp.]
MKAKSEAERAREYRERKRLREAGLLPATQPPSPLSYAKESFIDFLHARQDLLEAADWVRQQGVLNLDYLFRRLPTALERDKARDWTDQRVSDLITAIDTLAGLLNDYEVTQIDREIERLKAEDLSILATRGSAIDTIARLKAARKQLEKKFRISLPEYDIKD